MFKKIKQAFGFVDDDELINDDPETEAPSLPDAKSMTSSQVSDPTVNTDRIFTHVVEVFNAALPEFLKSGVNPDAQRRYLYDTLDADIKAHLDSLGTIAKEACESRWRADKDSLNQKLHQIENRSKELEEKRLELSQKQLSADRQKRALTDRVHDLEKQLSKLAADREQYELENKSLINKLKVAGVFEKENEELREELNRLQGEIIKLHNGKAIESKLIPNTELEAKLKETEVKLSEAENRVNEIQTNLTASTEKLTIAEEKASNAEERIAKAEKIASEAEAKLKDAEEKAQQAETRANNAEKEALDAAVRIEELEARKPDNNEQITKLRNEIEQAKAENNASKAEIDKAKVERDNAMSDKNKLAAELAEVKNRESEIASNFDALQNEIVELKRTITKLEDEANNRPSAEEITNLRNTAKEAAVLKEQFAAIESQITLFEDIKAKKDQQITSLKDELANLRHELAETHKKNLDVDSTQIEITLEKKVQPNIERRERFGRRSKNTPEPPIDDILSDTDWLVAPADKTSSSRSNDRRDSQNNKNNDSQLSLF